MCISIIVRLHVQNNLTPVSTVVYLLEMGSWSSFASGSLKQDQATKCYRVAEDLQGCDLSPKQKHGTGNQQDVLKGAKLLGIDCLW